MFGRGKVDAKRVDELEDRLMALHTRTSRIALELSDQVSKLAYQVASVRGKQAVEARETKKAGKSMEDQFLEDLLGKKVLRSYDLGVPPASVLGHKSGDPAGPQAGDGEAQDVHGALAGLEADRRRKAGP